MWSALEGFSTIAIVVGVGYLLARTRAVGRTAGRTLGDVAYFVGQPALVLVAVAEADLDRLLGAHVIAFGIACVGTGLAFALAARRFLGVTRAEATIGYLTTSYVNAGNLGIPIAAYVLGDAAWAAPAMLLQVLVLQPTAVAMLETTPTGRGRSVLRSFLTHPLVLGGAIGLTVNLSGWEPPSLIWSPLGLLADLGIPTMLLAFGMSFHWSPLPSLRRLTPMTVAAILVKVLVVPAVALGVGVLLGLSGAPLQAAVVLAGLPTAQIVFVHAMRYRTSTSLVQATTLWSTLLCVPVILAASTLLH